MMKGEIASLNQFKIDRIHSFDIRHSSTTRPGSIFAFSKFLFRFDRPLVWPAAALNR
ncbi:hypothetical protein D1AOALGA4SA_7996 [Olavius algarvensis Delta 1 endosymbiont]|nr:hypothetical protein D1AOALGA4SA_7996 [Olavius algarvensis Delta 1 endosymbiont]